MRLLAKWTLLILVSWSGSLAWSQADETDSAFPEVDFPVTRVNIKNYVGWENDLKKAKSLAKEWNIEYVRKFQEAYAQSHPTPLPPLEVNKVVNDWMVRTSQLDDVDQIFPERKLNEGTPSIRRDLILLVIRTTGLSPAASVGRVFPRPGLMPSDIPVAPFKKKGLKTLEVWRNRMKDFNAKYYEMYASQYSEMRGIPSQAFRFSPMVKAANASIDEISDLIEVAKWERFNLKLQSRTQLDNHARQIDQSGLPNLVAWFDDTKKRILSQYESDGSQTEELKELAKSIAVLESSFSAANLPTSSDSQMAMATFVEAEERLKRMWILAMVGFAALVLFIVFRFVVKGDRSRG